MKRRTFSILDPAAHPHLVPLLQRLFFIFGWGILILAASKVGIEVYGHFRGTAEGVHFLQSDFSMVNNLRLLSRSVAQAFFAFLMSAVFGMIFHRALIDMNRAEKFLKVTCFAFVGDSLIGLFGWLLMTPYYFSFGDLPFPDRLLAALSYSLSAVTLLEPIIYAVTIYILFYHFARMVEFEAEVV